MDDGAPWTRLPPALAPLLRSELPTLADEIIAAIAADVPEYARPLEGAFGRGVRRGVQAALRQFVALLADPTGPGRRRMRRLSAGLGRGEQRSGRTLESLQRAYGVGARVAWRRLARATGAAGLEPEALVTLAEAVFTYIDELSAAAVEGYAEAQASVAGEQEAARRRLLALVLQEPAAHGDEIRQAAAAARWALPTALAAVAWERSAANAARVLPIGSLSGVAGDAGCALIPDPDAPLRPAALAAAFAGPEATAWQGPTVPWTAAARSWRRARSALALTRSGAIRGAGLQRADDHLVDLLLDGDPWLMAELAERRLAWAQPLTPASRQRMLTTLEAALDHQGHVPTIAGALHVHQQTVRYRLGRLRELVGDGLDDPTVRLELRLALRVRPRRPEPD